MTDNNVYLQHSQKCLNFDGAISWENLNMIFFSKFILLRMLLQLFLKVLEKFFLKSEKGGCFVTCGVMFSWKVFLNK